MTKLVLLLLAGGLGAMARYGVSELVQYWYGGNFPWGTTLVNLAGCFLFGFVWILAHERSLIHKDASFLILTGFIGAFTTFSTFAFETSLMLKQSQWLSALANIALHNLGGLLAVFLGAALGRFF